MTQLIAAICENGAKVVALSDRMVTTVDRTLAFEPEFPKAVIVARNVLALTAGTIHEPELIEDVCIETKSGSIVEIAKRLAEKYQELRQTRIQNEILREIGFKSVDDFYNKQKLLHESLILGTNDRIQHYDLGAHILIVGVDAKAHLHYVCNPGTWVSYDSIGFLCIGSGDRHAEPVFALHNFTPSLTVREVLYITFEAKKRAEMAGGVGKATDAWVVDKEAVYEVSQETIAELETVYQQRQDESRRERFGRGITELKISTRKVEPEKKGT